MRGQQAMDGGSMRVRLPLWGALGWGEPRKLPKSAQCLVPCSKPALPHKSTKKTQIPSVLFPSCQAAYGHGWGWTMGAENQRLEWQGEGVTPVEEFHIK